eukprot:14413154-Alexandrium_andersonii.AAC.1
MYTPLVFVCGRGRHSKRSSRPLNHQHTLGLSIGADRRARSTKQAARAKQVVVGVNRKSRRMQHQWSGAPSITCCKHDRNSPSLTPARVRPRENTYEVARSLRAMVQTKNKTEGTSGSRLSLLWFCRHAQRITALIPHSPMITNPARMQACAGSALGARRERRVLWTASPQASMRAMYACCARSC